MNGHEGSALDRLDNKVWVVLGSQWGDEGKGKLVDLISKHVDVVARCQGGNNAGHTVVAEGHKYAFHLLPSGLVHDGVMGVLGNGVVVHIPQLFDEMEKNEGKAMAPIDHTRLKISDRAHIVFDFHQQVDGLQESKRESGMLGTTKKGIGPTYASKATRSGIRMADLVHGDFDTHFAQKFRRIVNDHMAQYEKRGVDVDVDAEIERYRQLADRIRPFVTETVSLMHGYLNSGKRVLVEGANASMLDLDFGTYPFVTSSNCSVGGVLTGLGIPPARLGEVYGVVKAYTTRVGTGAFPTEQANELGDYLQTTGAEFGVTTGRRRRCGWLDIPLLKWTDTLNNYTALALTKLDILDGLDEIKIGVTYKKNGVAMDHFPSSEQDFENIEVDYVTLPGWKSPISDCRQFEDLPENAKNYVAKIESLIGKPIRWIGVGQARAAIITCGKTPGLEM